MAIEVKRLSKWKSIWLKEKDVAGDSFSDYFVKQDEYNTKCLWCKKMIYFGSAGKAALSQHAKSKGHRQVADSRKQRNSGQVLLVPAEEEPNNNDCIDEPDEGEPETSEKEKSKQPKKFLLQKLAAPPTLPNNRFGLDDQVTAAETFLVLKAAESDWSFASVETLPQICAKVDPKSLIWPKVKLKQRKHSYMHMGLS